MNPHSFGLIDLPNDLLAHPLHVFTYGPIVDDLARLSSPTPERIREFGRTLGFEWLASIPRGTDGEPVTSALSLYLRKRYALRPGVGPNPFIERSGELELQPPEPVRDVLLADFAGEWATDLKHTGDEFRSYVAPLRAAAESGSRPQEDPRLVRRLRALRIPLEHVPASTGDGTEANPIPMHTNLVTRAREEIYALYTLRPQLRFCAHCDRVFVPRTTNQRYCRRLIWAWPGLQLVGACNPRHTTPTLLDLEARARRNAYKKLQMRARRAAARHGQHDPRAQEALTEFERWKRDNRTQRGRRQKPTPGDRGI